MAEANDNKSPFGKTGMFHQAGHFIFERAKQLRNEMTPAETMLWMLVKEGIEGCKCRRQHPIGTYIVDFFCFRAKLIIEVDGSVHDDPAVAEHDKQRQEELESWGYKVVRYKNEEVINNAEAVLAEIRKTVQKIISG